VNLNQILAKHNLSIDKLLKTSLISSTYIVNQTNNQLILKHYNEYYLDKLCKEKEFIKAANNHNLEYLKVPKLYNSGESYILIEYVDRMHTTRDTIIDYDWTKDKINLWTNGLLEFQSLDTPKKCFSLTKRTISRLFPIIRFLQLIKYTHFRFTNSNRLVLSLIIKYFFQIFNIKLVTTHYDLQTYNYCFSYDNIMSLIDYEFSHYRGDPFYDIIYYISIPIVLIHDWTFQFQLLKSFVNNGEFKINISSSRLRFLLLLCQLQRYHTFKKKGELVYCKVYQENIISILDNNQFYNFFNKL